MKLFESHKSTCRHGDKHHNWESKFFSCCDGESHENIRIKTR
ncbi:hypothetical protein OIU79_028920 [Salix purpurea]|uniref:Uncharacterized protein n=1 Tax=Salix purpurea TaxID=77065 RepID=A0A9Q1A3A0_SALPP|nr:hypothetical protein OIU79_028920 [Salix purpurea]